MNSANLTSPVISLSRAARRVVVVGGGPAAHCLVEKLRQGDHTGPIVLLGAENQPAYNRVLLGSVLDGSLPADATTLPELDAEVYTGCPVTGIDRRQRVVHTADGRRFGYEMLVLATGARPVLPEIPDLPDARLTALRTLDDCARLERVEGPIVVLGGGILGVEAARALLARGRHVALVHSRSHLMNRQIDDVSGRLLADRLGKFGVDVRLGVQTVSYQGGNLVLDDGRSLPAAMVLACTGVRPNTELAKRAGLSVSHGVVVDERLRTSDGSIHAIGDCAEHHGQSPGLVADALEQAKILARLLTGGEPEYHGTSTVARLKVRGIDLVSLGSAERLHSTDAEVVTLSDPARARYAKLALHAGRISGAVLVGFPEAIATISQLHDRALPMPSDRLALLLGTPTAVPGASVELPEDAILCRCNNVTKKSLTTAWHDGARSVAELAKATRATTGCGSCVDDVGSLCSALATRLDKDEEGAA